MSSKILKTELRLQERVGNIGEIIARLDWPVCGSGGVAVGPR
jgi:hypothetical protein